MFPCKCRNIQACALQGIGHSLSGYASIILKSDEQLDPNASAGAHIVHPDSLQRLNIRHDPADVLSSPSKLQSPHDEWFDRFSNDVSPRQKQARLSPCILLKCLQDKSVLSG